MPQHSPARVWALLGPHRGDNNQILALADALGSSVRGEEFALQPAAADPAGHAWRDLCERGQPPAARGSRAEPPDLTISTGLRSVPVVRELRRRSGWRTRSVHLGFRADFAEAFRPGGADAGISGARCAQRHAASRSRSALMPAKAIEQSDRDLLNAYPQPRRLFLVGGPTLYWELPVDRMTAALWQLLEAAQSRGRFRSDGRESPDADRVARGDPANARSLVRAVLV